MDQKDGCMLATAVTLMVFLAGCPPQNPYEGMRASSVLAARDGRVVGQVQLKEETNGVSINATLKGLPQGRHGFHIHEKGACQGPDFASAGSHYNPENRMHGVRNPGGFHSGDLPNIEINEKGEGSLSMLWYDIALGPRDHSILKEGGTSFIIHELPDDDVADPSGNAGARIACGSILGFS